VTTAPDAGVYPQRNVTDFVGVYDLVETRQVGERIPHVAVVRSEVLWSGVGTTLSQARAKARAGCSTPGPRCRPPWQLPFRRG